MKAKVKKVMLWPSRTIELKPGYGYAKLSAGIEFEFDEAVDLDDLEVQKALQKGREMISNEFKAQYQPYKKLMPGYKPDSKK